MNAENGFLIDPPQTCLFFLRLCLSLCAAHSLTHAPSGAARTTMRRRRAPVTARPIPLWLAELPDAQCVVYGAGCDVVLEGVAVRKGEGRACAGDG